MAITNAEVLAFVNRVLKRSETDIDTELQTVLDELSSEDLLESSDTSQSLASGDTYLDYPSGFRSVIAITLNDGTYEGKPLDALDADEYLRLMEDGDSSDYDEPDSYCDLDSKLYIYPPADGTYTATIRFRKNHDQDPDNIEFDDAFRNCIYFGTAYYVAATKADSRYIGIWGPRYELEKQKRRENVTYRPCITRMP